MATSTGERSGIRITDFAHSYAALPEGFFVRTRPTPVREPRLIRFNEPLAADLGIDCGALDVEEMAQVFAGNLLPEGADPLAMAYAGHQFGQFVPQLGDGRALLLGEVRDRGGAARDVQLKGSGRTPFSRGGDGRAALGPVLREYVVSEAMHALGIPGTRALAAVTTGETVRRDGLLPGAILTRVAASHVRVGTFQYFAARGNIGAVRRLADYVIDRHYPHVRDRERPYLSLLEAIGERQALLIARWLHVGFIHGVMNTDNMAVAGETIDFGPCAFMDAYDPATVFSSIDGMGRYAYANQPHAAQWNLARLAETLLPLLDPDQARAVELASEALSQFSARFEHAWLAGMRRKLGLLTDAPADLDLIHAWLALLHANRADYTLAFRSLGLATVPGAGDASVRAQLADPAAFDEWAAHWRARLAAEPTDPPARAEAMRTANPAVIPRNHRVEQALAAAVEHDDYVPFGELLEVLARPYEDDGRFQRYQEPPRPDERVLRTFCGT
jgi:uncharacterized protein YdiU (UPF0061 family)